MMNKPENEWTGQDYIDLAKNILVGGDDAEGRTPLDQPYTQGIDLGWVSRFAEWGHKITGSPVEFFELIGWTTLAAAVPDISIPLAFAGDAGLRANIYGCIVAPSSMYGKSTALNKALSVLQADLMPNCAVMPGTFTEEGLYSELSENNAGIIVKDEIGMLFDSHKKKYMHGVTQALTQIYDGGSFSKRLSSVRIDVENPCLNIIGATTPYRFHNGVRTVDWHDGFLARWLIVVPSSDPDFGYTPPLWNAELQQERSALASFLLDAHKRGEQAFTFHADTYAIYEQWRKQRLQEAYEYQNEIFNGFVARYCTYALKFAMLLSVARSEEWGVITEQCMRDGIALADNYKRHLQTLLTEKQERTVDGGKLQTVFSVIRRLEQESGDGVTRGNIANYANIPASVRDECLDKLLEIGAISEQKSKQTGRKRIYSNVEKLPIRSVG